MDRPVNPKRRRWRLYAALGGIASLALAATGLIAVRDTRTAPARKSPVVAASPEPPAMSATERAFAHQTGDLAPASIPSPEPTKPIPKRLADAFEAATGHRNAYSVSQEGHSGTVSPLKIIQLPFGPALLTRTYFSRTCGRCTDVLGTYYLRERIGVYYLKESAGRFAVKGRWPEAVDGVDWTDSPIDWELTDRFTTYPAIFASILSSFHEGIVQDGVSLTELRPTGPIESDYVGTLYSSDGRPSYDTPVCIARGRITNIRKDRSFDLVVTGSQKRRVDHFVKRNGKFKIVGESTMWHMPCGVR